MYDEEILDLANNPDLERIFNQNDEAFDLEYQDWLDQYQHFDSWVEEMEERYGDLDQYCY